MSGAAALKTRDEPLDQAAAEADLAALFEDYKSQVAAISRSQAVIEFTLDGHILDANENFLAVTGYSLDEIKGKHHGMFCDAAYRSSAEYRAFWDKLGRGVYDSASTSASARAVARSGSRRATTRSWTPRAGR